MKAVKFAERYILYIFDDTDSSYFLEFHDDVEQAESSLAVHCSAGYTCSLYRRYKSVIND